MIRAKLHDPQINRKKCRPLVLSWAGRKIQKVATFLTVELCSAYTMLHVLTSPSIFLHSSLHLGCSSPRDIPGISSSFIKIKYTSPFSRTGHLCSSSLHRFSSSSAMSPYWGLSASFSRSRHLPFVLAYVPYWSGTPSPWFPHSLLKGSWDVVGTKSILVEWSVIIINLVAGG